jgi:hypothetical protein
MAKSDLAPLLIAIFVVEFITYAFTGNTAVGTVFFDLIVSGSLFSANAFWTWITSNLLAVVGVAGAGAIIIGTVGSNKQDFVVFAGIVLVFISYGGLFIKMINLFTEQLNRFGFLDGGASFIAIMMLAPIMILYIVTLLKFWRGTD